MSMLHLQTALILSLLLAVSGCLNLQQQPRLVDFYILEYEAAPPLEVSPLPVVLQVERFGAEPPFDTPRMIYSTKPFERNAYTYHQWQSPPGNLVAYRLAHDLQNAGILQAVSPPHGRLVTTHILQGTVHEFLEVDTTGGAVARISLSIMVIRRDEPDPVRRIILQTSYQEQERFRAGQPVELARALSQALARLSRYMIQDIYDALND